VIKPYYDDGKGIVIYHGDCRNIIPALNEVDMIATDPPYGVGYRGGHFHSGNVNIRREREKLQGDQADIYEEIIPMCLKVCRGPCYFFFAGTRALSVYQAISNAGGDVHALIIWHKINATYAAMNAQYKQRHEPILYCTGKGGKTLWCGSSRESTIWEIGKDPQNFDHPTRKPVALMAKMIQNHKANVILDPFMGSGTTLVAAKMLGRKAIGIEIEEKYCRVAVRRIESCPRPIIPVPTGGKRIKSALPNLGRP
jgi:DNA modification methylase